MDPGSVLFVDEILRLIVADIYKSEAYASLVNLATACKSFQEPALDQLWHYQISLVPFIKCMPDDLWRLQAIDDFQDTFQTAEEDTRSNPGIRYELVFTRPIQPSD
ncbi:hypothetical protein PLICRDRAFT_170829 [Plicaturopsis crispa FD-325 SS-3]|nr:hypothetical protein PLICRDRAFT_170829 [Plicaturopsis crispa FD-325 SS-3]